MDGGVKKLTTLIPMKCWLRFKAPSRRPFRGVARRMLGAGLLIAGLLPVVLVAAGLDVPPVRRIQPLPETAWIRFGDDPSWAEPDVDLAGWTEVKLRGALRRQGVAVDPAADFVWYRVELPRLFYPETVSLNLHLAGVAGASEGFLNGQQTPRSGQDFTGRIGERPRFPPAGLTHTFRWRRAQWNQGGPNVFALRVQRAPRATGIEEGASFFGFALALRPLQEADHRRNDLWEGMALAVLGLGLLTALGLAIADRTDGLSRGMIPVFAVLAGYVVLNSHAFFRTPWSGHWTMRAGWVCAAVAMPALLGMGGRLGGAPARRSGLICGAAAGMVGIGLMLAVGFRAMSWAHYALTVLIGATTLAAAAGVWRAATAEPRWSRPVLLGVVLLLGVWTLNRAALHLGYDKLATATRPHFYALLLVAAFFAALVLRLRLARDDYRRLLRANLTAQEDERRRLARDLHDGVGQALQALKLRLQLERRVRGDREDAIPPELPDSVDAMDGCIQELRAVAANLRPVYLGRMPLAEALRIHAEQFGRDAGVIVRFESTLAAPLTPAAEEHLFRIQQEALNNAVRHGHPCEIEVRLETVGSKLRLVIADDGDGESESEGEGGTPAPSVLSGHGLRNLRERAELLGGTLVFTRGPGGAQVVVEVPHMAKEER